MWTQGDYTPGSISQLLSGGTGEKKKKRTETLVGSLAKKNVQFENVSDKKEHKKYAETPYSELQKKKSKGDFSSEHKPEKRKLIFDETEKAELPKKSKKSKKKKDIDEMLSSDVISDEVSEKQKLLFDDETKEAGHQKKSKKAKKNKDVNKMSCRTNISYEVTGKQKVIFYDKAEEVGHSKKKKKKNIDAVSNSDDINHAFSNSEQNENYQKFADSKNMLMDFENVIEDINYAVEKKKNKKHKKSKSRENRDETSNDKGAFHESKKLKFIDKEDELENPSLVETEHTINDNNHEDKSSRPNKKNKKLNDKNQEQKSTVNNTNDENVPIKPNNATHKLRPTDPEEQKKTIFVGNVPLNYTMKDVSRIFSEFGPVCRTRLRCIPVAKLGMSKKEAVCRKEFHPKRKSMAAYVVFKSEESVAAALEKNGMLVDGHHLRIDLPNRDKEHDTNKAIFVGNLPFDVEDDEVWEVFEKCGEIENVRVVRDSFTMIGKGFGYVNFTSSASVELALELDGQEIRNRKINVTRCMKIKKKKKFNKGENLNVEKRGKNFNRFDRKSKTEKFNLNKVKVTANQVGSATQFQGSKAGKEKKKKKKRLSKYETKRRKVQKILAPSLNSGKKNKKTQS